MMPLFFRPVLLALLVIGAAGPASPAATQPEPKTEPYKFMYYATAFGFLFCTYKADVAYDSTCNTLAPATEQNFQEATVRASTSIFKTHDSSFCGMCYGVLGAIEYRGNVVLAVITGREEVTEYQGDIVWKITKVTLLPPLSGIGFVNRRFGETIEWHFEGGGWYYSKNPNTLLGDEKELHGRIMANRHMVERLEAFKNGAISETFKDMIPMCIYGNVVSKGDCGFGLLYITAIWNANIGLSRYAYGMNSEGYCAYTGSVKCYMYTDEHHESITLYRGPPPVIFTRTQIEDNLPIAANPGAFGKFMGRIKPDIIVGSLSDPKERPVKEALQKQLGDDYRNVKMIYLQKGGIISKALDVQKACNVIAEHLDVDPNVYVCCLDSVGDVDEVIEAILGRFFHKHFSGHFDEKQQKKIKKVIHDICDVTREKISKAYLGAAGSMHSNIIQKLIRLITSLWTKHLQWVMDQIFGTKKVNRGSAEEQEFGDKLANVIADEKKIDLEAILKKEEQARLAVEKPVQRPLSKGPAATVRESATKASLSSSTQTRPKSVQTKTQPQEDRGWLAWLRSFF